MIRGFEEQFEGETVMQIKNLLQRIESIKLPHRVSKYYIVDLSLCLQAGALLGALHLAASLMEITIREMVISVSTEALPEGGCKRSLQRELEENRSWDFYKLVSKLETEGFFDSKDSELAKNFYKDIRIPLHHGLPRRFLSKHDGISKLFEEASGGTYQTSMHDFERVIEEDALHLIEIAVGIVERNQNKKSHTRKYTGPKKPGR